MIRSLIWFIILYILFLLAPKNKCKHRISLTYLLLTISLFGIYFIQYDLQSYQKIIQDKQLIITILSFIILFAILFSNKNTPIKSFLYILFIFLLAILFQPVFNYGKNKNILISTLITTTILFLLLSGLTEIFPEFIYNSWGSYLFFGLVSLIIFRICLLFYPTIKIKKYWTYSSYIAIILFSGFILYDTKNMIIRSKQCNIEYDYVDNILNLFLDILNIFTEILTLNKN